MKRTLLLIVLGAPLLIAGRCDEVDRHMQESLGRAGDGLSGFVDENEAAVGTVVPLIPGSAGWVATVVWAVFVTLRAYHNRRRAHAIIGALESVKADNRIDFSDAHTREELDRLMGRGGKRLVDEVQGKAVPIPV